MEHETIDYIAKSSHTCQKIGVEVRRLVNRMPFNERNQRTTSILKPENTGRATLADAKGEEKGVELLDDLSRKTGVDIHLIVDPIKGDLHKIGSNGSKEIAFAYMDAVDGTWKVAGVGGVGIQGEDGPSYQANDGNWGIGVSLTLPTESTLDKLVIGDFKISAITTGNPRSYACAAEDVITYPVDGVHLETFSEMHGENRRVYTSSQGKLGQTFGQFDAFQGFDRNTAEEGTEDLMLKLWESLANRNEGGCFDLTRSYGSLSALTAHMLGWRDPELPESCGGIYLAFNESQPNLIPAVPVIIGAGGIATDIHGAPLVERNVDAPRTNIIYIANEELQSQVMPLIEKYL